MSRRKAGERAGHKYKHKLFKVLLIGFIETEDASKNAIQRTFGSNKKKDTKRQAVTFLL